jgi:hypothetical protein
VLDPAEERDRRYAGNLCDHHGLMANLPAPSGWTPAQFFGEPLSLGEVQLLHAFEFDQQLSCQLRIMAVALQLRDDFTLSTNVLRALGYVIFGRRQVPQKNGSVHWQMLSDDFRFSYAIGQATTTPPSLRPWRA